MKKTSNITLADGEKKIRVNNTVAIILPFDENIIKIAPNKDGHFDIHFRIGNRVYSPTMGEIKRFQRLYGSNSYSAVARYMLGEVVKCQTIL